MGPSQFEIETKSVENEERDCKNPTKTPSFDVWNPQKQLESTDDCFERDVIPIVDSL
jgi:hypothetical protein